MSKKMNLVTILSLFFLIFFVSCDDNTEVAEDGSPCSGITCSEHGECALTNEKAAVCICDNGYYVNGLNCVEDGTKITCEDIECSDNSSCEMNGETPQCICDENYHIKNNICIKDVDPCETNPCKESHKTVCEALSMEEGDYSCICDDGFTQTTNGCEELSEVKLRLMAANTTTGRYGFYQSDGIRIFQAIDPDVIMVQEFLYDGSIDTLVEKIYGAGCLSQKKCFYYRGDRSKPNGIISKYKIIDHGFWRDSGYSDRNLDWAIIDIPGNIELYAISVHLSTKGSEQVAPARMIATKIAAHKAANPGKYYYVVGGDFNGSTAVGGFTSSNAFDGSDPYPESEKCRTGKGSYKCTNTNHGRTKHYDWILESSNLSKFRVTTKLCKQNDKNDCLEYPKSLVFDTREYINKSDYILPAKLNDSSDEYMQHMSIIKDFIIKF